MDIYWVTLFGNVHINRTEREIPSQKESPEYFHFSTRYVRNGIEVMDGQHFPTTLWRGLLSRGGFLLDGFYVGPFASHQSLCQHVGWALQQCAGALPYDGPLRWDIGRGGNVEDERVLRLEEPLASAAKKSEGRRVTGLKHSMSHLNMILRSHLTGLATRLASP